MLIDAGADYTTAVPSGFTPFLFAIREGHFDVAKLLLDQGIDVNQEMIGASGKGRSPTGGMSPLLLAIENGHFELP